MRKAFLFIVLSILCMEACSEKELDPNSAENSYAIAKEPFDKGDYETAVRRLGEFKTRFPYSQYVSEAERLIADSHYNLGQYSEAASGYSHYYRLYPKHAQAPYALFRVGLCYWQIAPDNEDRDQEFTEKAVEKWQELQSKFHESEYSSQAQEYINKGKNRLARASTFIARFYCRQEIWHACAYRSMLVIEHHKDQLEQVKEACALGIKAFRALANEKQRDPENISNLYVRDDSPEQLRARADQLEAQLAKLNQAAPQT